MCLCQAGKLGPWGVYEEGSQGVCACMYRCAHMIISLCVSLGMQTYGIHRCLYTGSLCVCVYPQVCVCLFSYWGKMGLVLTNLNWSGWVLATDIITVQLESLPCPGYAGCAQCAAV